jgi:hypothetical protein
VVGKLSLSVGPAAVDVLKKLALSRSDALKIFFGGLVQGYFFAWLGELTSTCPGEAGKCSLELQHRDTDAFATSQVTFLLKVISPQLSR